MASPQKKSTAHTKPSANINDTGVGETQPWQAHSVDRLFVARLGVVTGGVVVLIKIIGAFVINGVSVLDALDDILLLVGCALGLKFSKLLNSTHYVLVCCFVWTLMSLVAIGSSIAAVWTKTDILARDDKHHESTTLLLVALRTQSIPHVTVITFAALGVPLGITIAQGLVLFLLEGVFSVCLRQSVHALDFTDYASVVCAKIFAAFVTLYLVWTVEKNQRRTRESLSLLKQTMHSWLREKDVDRATRTRIVGYIFHEVRNPLNNITLAADLLSLRLQQHTQTQNASEEWSEMTEMVDAISKAADSACHVLNDALSLQKLEAGTFEFVKQPFSLVKFQSQALRVANPLMQQKNIDLSSEMDPSLESVNVFGDFNRLQQVLNNFLSNAYKFTPNQGKVVVCMNKLRETHSGKTTIMTIKISVQDSGTGIAPSDRGRIFQPWSQIRASDLQQGQGSGLGLSLCKAFVEVGHKGRIGFDSEPGVGSTFYFEVDFLVCENTAVAGVHTRPLARRGTHGSENSTSSSALQKRSNTANSGSRNNMIRVKEASAKLSRHNMANVIFPNAQSNLSTAASEVEACVKDVVTEAQAISQPLQATAPNESTKDMVQRIDSRQLLRFDSLEAITITKDVLVVDDSLVTRKLLCKILSTVGVSFETCANGKEAVDLIVEQNCCYRIIIMDKEMPVMDGFEATKTLRAADYGLPIVGLTGNAMDDQVAAFLSAGVNAVFSKPIKRDEFVSLLHQYNVRTTAEGDNAAAQPPQNLAPTILDPKQARQIAAALTSPTVKLTSQNSTHTEHTQADEIPNITDTTTTNHNPALQDSPHTRHDTVPEYPTTDRSHTNWANNSPRPQD